VKEFIEAEKARTQGLLRLFNERGGRMEVFDEDKKRLFGELVDSFTVTRIAPHFDAQGKHTHSDFWLLWKSVGYNNGWQYAHTVKVVQVTVRDTLENCWLIVDLTDDRGRRFHVELIEPISELDYAHDWRDWQKYKAANAEMFAHIDAELLREHLQIAEGWA
jgi:hypothetical protein